MNHCWQWSISLILKVSGMLIRSIHAQLEWMKVFINNIILRLSFSAISLWVSSFLGLPSLVLQPKVWASGCLIFPSISMTALGAKRQTDRDRTQKQQRSSHFFGTTAPSVEEGGPSSSFCFCGCPLAFRQDLVQLLSCVQLCDSTNYSTPGYPVLHCLSEFTQIKGHWVSDIVQPFHLLLPPSPLDLNLSQHQTLLQWVSCSNQVAKVQSIGTSYSASVLAMNIRGWFPLGTTGLISLPSEGLLRVFSSTTIWKY